METKECTGCKKVKPLNEFYKRHKTDLKRTSRCKSCRKLALKKYRTTDAGKKALIKINQSKAARKSKSKYRNSKRGKLTRNKYLKTEDYKKLNKNSCRKYTATLPDSYLKKLLRNTHGLINPSQACIELKRVQVKEIRLFKQLKKESKNGNKQAT